MLALKSPARAVRSGSGRLRAPRRRSETIADDPGQQRRPARAHGRESAWRAIRAEARAERVLREGQLLLADAARARSRAWSTRCPSPAASACTSRSTWPGRRASGRTSNGSSASATTVDPRRAERFYAAIRRYWPGLPDGALAPGYSGIRPKTAGPGEPAPDFADPGPARARRPRAGAPLRHRVARPDRVASPSPAWCWRNYAKIQRSPQGETMHQKALVRPRRVRRLRAAAQAQTKWDMPTPYSDGEFHTRNVKAFVEDVKKNTGGAARHHGALQRLADQAPGHPARGVDRPGQHRRVPARPVRQRGPGVRRRQRAVRRRRATTTRWKFYQAQKPVLEKKLQGRGLKLLYAVAWPGQGIYTKDPLKSVDRLQGH